jgi:hypothetical protein
MAKKSRKRTGQKLAPSGKRRTAPTPSKPRTGAARRATSARRGGTRKAAGAKTLKAAARRKQTRTSPRPGTSKIARRAASATPARRTATRAKRVKAVRKPVPRLGGTGREEALAQTPEAGRTKRGRTNPMATRRSTGTPAGAGTSRSPRLDRARRTLREVEEGVPTPPSSLDIDRRGPSAARSGREHLQQAREDHPETSPVLTGGDVDADWQDAYAAGDEAVGGDNPTPDQDRVDDIGKALGVEYQDNEELKAADKIAERDRHRWELDPASAEDYTDRD